MTKDYTPSSHLEVVRVDSLRLGIDGELEGAGQGVGEEQGQHLLLHEGQLLRQLVTAIPGDHLGLVVTLLRNHLDSRPIRGQYPGHVITLHQSEASILIT